MPIFPSAPFGHSATQNAARTALGLTLAAAAAAAGAVAQAPPQRATSAAAVPTSSTVTIHAVSSLRAALTGLAVLQGASPSAEALAAFLRGEGGQAVLRRYGFSAP